MNCKYCQQPTEEISRMKVGNSHIINLMCDICHVDYQYIVDPREDPLLNNETLRNISIKNKLFRINYHYGPKLTSVEFFKTNHDFGNVVGVATGEWKQIHIFPFIVDWTPQNVKEKLERLLIFM